MYYVFELCLVDVCSVVCTYAVLLEAYKVS